MEYEEEPVDGSEEDREEKQDDNSYDYHQGYPEQSIKDSIIKFFRDILKLKDSTKVSNINKTDLHNVRLFKDTGAYLEAEGNTELKKYFDVMAENILSTAMSKDGFFLNTAVTQVRKVQRVKGEPSPEKKGGLFSFGGKNENQEQ